MKFHKKILLLALLMVALGSAAAEKADNLRKPDDDQEVFDPGDPGEEIEDLEDEEYLEPEGDPGERRMQDLEDNVDRKLRELEVIRANVCSGVTYPKEWRMYGTRGIYVDLRLPGCPLRDPRGRPLSAANTAILTSLEGTGFHWRTTGVTSIYWYRGKPRIYVYYEGGFPPGYNALALARARRWSVNWRMEVNF